LLIELSSIKSHISVQDRLALRNVGKGSRKSAIVQQLVECRDAVFKKDPRFFDAIRREIMETSITSDSTVQDREKELAQEFFSLIKRRATLEKLKSIKLSM